MVIIGMTGGIGSGKSTLSQYMVTNHQALLIEADKIGHQAYLKGTSTYQAVIKAFGQNILNSQLEIDRKLLGDIAFNDSDKLEILNQIVHPYIYKTIKDIVTEEKKQQRYDYIVIDAALLFEIKLVEFIDFLILVFADEEVRIHRISQSRIIELTKIRHIIDHQSSDESLHYLADFEIDNSFSLNDSYHQLEEILTNMHQQMKGSLE